MPDPTNVMLDMGLRVILMGLFQEVVKAAVYGPVLYFAIKKALEKAAETY